jgi:hypothetical protein
MHWSFVIVSPLVLATSASAQVGHVPVGSPYRDLEYKQELTFIAGQFNAARDLVGIAPRSGVLVGGRWDIRLGGPAYFYGRVTNVFTDRVVIDPTKDVDERTVGTDNVPLMMLDVGFGLNITGFKTWHGLAPMIQSGIGVAGDLSNQQDVGGFAFGTSFLWTLGAGVKYSPGGRWQWRADLGSNLYRIKYPDTYFLKTGEADAVLPPEAPRRQWRYNTGLTLGLAYLFDR